MKMKITLTPKNTKAVFNQKRNGIKYHTAFTWNDDTGAGIEIYFMRYYPDTGEVITAGSEILFRCNTSEVLTHFGKWLTQSQAEKLADKITAYNPFNI